ncbi:cation transport ATPase [Tabrizicola sp. TH137]|uniref:cation transport ATPase n=1 Tax=Tabrizicola sp. TH137 TaxID=2067452 RepID=UPI00117FE607|nr:cation transport ATPase [Tabrizicola sp. TH137]
MVDRVSGRRLVGRGGRAVLLAAGLFLAGCVTTGGGLRSVALLDGALIAAAPAGYCLAPGAGRRSGDGAVVLMGRCSAASTAEPAVLTLSVGPAGSAGAMTAGGAGLAAYFTSAEGRAALSREGRAGDVVVLEAVGSGEAFLLHVRDRAVGDYWRAVTGIRGRLVTVSASRPDGEALAEGKGRALVEAAVAALRRANAG